MPDHKFRPSGHSNASSQPMDSCLECGRTEAAHATPPASLVLIWNDKEYAFATVEDARRARFFVEVTQ